MIASHRAGNGAYGDPLIRQSCERDEDPPQDFIRTLPAANRELSRPTRALRPLGDIKGEGGLLLEKIAPQPPIFLPHLIEGDGRT